MSSLETQLTDAQEMMQEETRQKLGVQSRLRQFEEKVENIQDQLEEEEEHRKGLEAKNNALNTQVGMSKE